MKGLPGSGKTEYAKKLIDDQPGKYARISKSDIRRQFFGDKWSKQIETAVVRFRNRLIRESLEIDMSVIVDDMNLHESHIDSINNIVETFKAAKAGLVIPITVKDITDVPIDVCINRDLKREHSVGEQTIRRLHAKYIEANEESRWQDDYEKSDSIIVDLEGSAFIGDKSMESNRPIEDLVSRFSSTHKVYFISDQHEKFRDRIEAKIESSLGVHHFKLLMRPDGDKSPEDAMKRKMYVERISEVSNVAFVVDDRPSSVRMWQGCGLFVFKVGPMYDY